MTKKLFVKTHGCQMNEYDSAKMIDLLKAEEDFELVDSEDQADLLILNTCSIREKAEQKTFSLFGGLKPLKAINPNLILGLTGCMGQQDGEKMLKRMPFLDFVLGPDQVEGIGKAVNRARESEKSFVWTGFDSKKIYSIPK